MGLASLAASPEERWHTESGMHPPAPRQAALDAGLSWGAARGGGGGNWASSEGWCGWLGGTGLSTENGFTSFAPGVLKLALSTRAGLQHPSSQSKLEWESRACYLCVFVCVWVGEMGPLLK